MSDWESITIDNVTFDARLVQHDNRDFTVFCKIRSYMSPTELRLLTSMFGVPSRVKSYLPGITAVEYPNNLIDNFELFAFLKYRDK